MAHRVTLIPGDGTGPEVIAATRRVIDAADAGIDWDERQAGAGAIGEYGAVLPGETLESIRRNRVALKGPLTTPVGKGFRSVNVALRQELGLYACVRPCKLYPGVSAPFPNVDIVVVRENTEDLYAGIEFEKGLPETGRLISTIEDLTERVIRADSGVSIKPISVAATANIVRFACEYARANGRSRVTAVHKANIMKFSDGLFLETAREVAQEYPDVEFEDRIVDALSMQLVKRPHDFDVLVLPNLYGDIISDLCAGLVGGLGVAPGANIGPDAAVFEPTHGSAPRYAGQNKVNPIAAMLSAVLMLRYLAENAAADRVEGAIAAVIAEGESVTYDLKADRNDPSAAGTSDVADAVIAKMAA